MAQASGKSVNEPIIVNTVADLETMGSTNLPKPVDGQLVQTLGYYTVGDGGGNSYRYVAADTSTVDWGFVMDGLGGDNSQATSELVLSAAGTGTGRFLAVQDDGWINCLQFGASPSLADNHFRIQAALDAGANNGGPTGATVRLPHGTYVVTTGVEVPINGFTTSNVHFTGDGIGTVLNYPGNDTAVLVNGHVGDSLSNMQITMAFGTSATGVEVRGDLTINGVFAFLGNIGFDISPATASDVKMTNCRAELQGLAGIGIGSNVDSLIIEHSEIATSLGGGIVSSTGVAPAPDVLSQSRAILRDVRIQGCLKNAIATIGRDITVYDSFIQSSGSNATTLTYLGQVFPPGDIYANAATIKFENCHMNNFSSINPNYRLDNRAVIEGIPGNNIDTSTTLFDDTESIVSFADSTSQSIVSNKAAIQLPNVVRTSVLELRMVALDDLYDSYIQNDIGADSIAPPFVNTNGLTVAPALSYSEPHGLVRQATFAASAGSQTTNKFELDFYPTHTDDVYYYGSFLIKSDVDTTVKTDFQIVGAGASEAGVSAQLMADQWTRIIILNKVSPGVFTGNASTFIIYPEDAAGAQVQICKYHTWEDPSGANGASPYDIHELMKGGFNSTVGPGPNFSDAAPTAGTWRIGDRLYNVAPAGVGSIGWVCTVAGTPGTWVAF